MKKLSLPWMNKFRELLALHERGKYKDRIILEKLYDYGSEEEKKLTERMEK